MHRNLHTGIGTVRLHELIREVFDGFKFLTSRDDEPGLWSTMAHFFLNGPVPYRNLYETKAWAFFCSLVASKPRKPRQCPLASEQ